MAVRACVLRGAGTYIASGRGKTAWMWPQNTARQHFLSYKDGDLAGQILERTHGKGVDKVVVAGGNADTFDAAIRMVKPGGIIANVNYLGEGDFVKIPRTEWGCGMAHKQIRGGLMPGGRLRTERLAAPHRDRARRPVAASYAQILRLFARRAGALPHEGQNAGPHQTRRLSELR